MTKHLFQTCVCHLRACCIMLLWFCQSYSVSLVFATPTPAVGLIKTISRTKEGSPLYQTTSSATDMVPEGHSCQGLAPLRRRRWIYQPLTASDECLSRTTASNRLLAGMQMLSQDLKWNNEPSRIVSVSVIPVVVRFQKGDKKNLLFKMYIKHI